MSAVGRFGHWVTDPAWLLLPQSNTIRLTAPLGYVDRHGEMHALSVDTESDGASIPQWAWSFVGSPLDRRYRRAAAFHDRDFDHRMFYDMLRADGVHPLRAAAFYVAVATYRQ